MSQNSVVLPTTGTISGLQMTQATNNALDTLNTLASGASAPSAPQAGQLWHDTSSNCIKMRSADNTAWIALTNIHEASYTAIPVTKTASSGFVNRIINGEMLIDQVNEGASYTIPVNNTYTYTADQWVTACLSASASAVSAQVVNDAPAGFRKSLKITTGSGATSVAATDYLVVWQPIEADNISDLGLGTLNAGSMSVSFWVKASIAGTYAVVLQNTGGGRSCVNKFTVATGGTWQFVTIPAIPCDQSGTWASGNSAGLCVYFVLAVGSTYQTATVNAWLNGAYYGSNTQTNSLLTTSGATFQVTGIMFNSGVFCLPYEKRNVGQELIACQRYFEKTFNTGVAVQQNAGTTSGDLFIISSNTASAVNYGWWHFSTRKRVSPTITTYNIGALNANWRDTTTATDKAAALLGSNEWGAGIFVNAATAVADNLRIHVTANARM